MQGYLAHKKRLAGSRGAAEPAGEASAADEVPRRDLLDPHRRLEPGPPPLC